MYDRVIHHPNEVTLEMLMNGFVHDENFLFSLVADDITDEDDENIVLESMAILPLAARRLAEAAARHDNALMDRMKSLVNREPVMLFMKGNPESPKCDLSQAMVTILNERW